MSADFLSLRVAIIYSGRFPWNRGVAQLYDSLKNIGHHAVVLARSSEKRFDGTENFNFVCINMRTSDSVLSRLKTYPVAINPMWRIFIQNNLKRFKPDCLFVRETVLLAQTFSVAQSLGIPLFVDMRENMGLLFSTSRGKGISGVFRNERFINKVEDIYLRKCAHIFTVTEELSEWVIEKYGIDSDRVSVLGNYPAADFISASEKCNLNEKKKLNLPVRIVYAGNLSEGKGIQDIIKALSIVCKKTACSLTVIGEGPYISNLKSLVVSEGVEKQVTFQPLVKPESVPETLSEFDIGLCPYLVNPFSDQTMPGKLFEYMCVGLPVLCSARKPVARVVDEARCGVIYNHREPQEIAYKLLNMIDNEVESLNMGKNGRKAVLEKYNYGYSRTVLERVIRQHLG
jgi:hypothetical protein